MAPSEHTEADVNAQMVAVRRIVVYVLAGLALLVVLWSLIQGGERDLWTSPSALLGPVIVLLVL